MRICSFTVGLALAALLLNSARCPAENWPAWRGPSRQGVSTETGLPTRWTAAENIAWKTPLPDEGWSSPIVWGSRVFVTAASDGGTVCRVVAVDAKSGQLLWDRPVFKQKAGHKQERNSYATPTPATDGERVYAVFGDGSFAALNFSGEILWTNRELPFYSEHGLGTSPILWNNLLIMARDASNEGDPKTLGWQKPWDKSFVVALDTKTGQVRWKTYRGLSRIGHVTPNLWTAPDGMVQVVSGAGDVLQGFNARSGDLVWTAQNIGEGVVPSVIIGDGVAFTACGWSGRESIKAFRLGGKGDLGETSLLWEQKRSMPRIPSYLYLSPHLFMVTEAGQALCLKADTGEIVWQQRIGGPHSASPVAAEGRIYFLADNGDTTVIQAKPEFELVAQNKLEEKVQASMAIAGGRLFVRGVRHLYCIGAHPGS